MKDTYLKLKAPVMVQFEMTPSCNNNCRFCYNFWANDHDSKMKRTTIVDETRIDRILDVLISNEVPSICFTGGEPLMAKDQLYSLIKKAASSNKYISINTNGRLVDKQCASKLKEIGLNSLLVSLHGDSEETHDYLVGCDGAFDETIQGIENLVNEGLNLTVNYVVTKNNIAHIVSTSELLQSKGVKNMTVTPILPFPGVVEHFEMAMAKDQFKQYFDSLHYAKEKGLKVDSTLPIAPCILKDMFPETWGSYMDVLSTRVCMAGVTFMVVSPEGINRACIQIPELSEYGSTILPSLDSAWQKTNGWASSELIPKECSTDCCALGVCGGGCRNTSLAINGAVCGKTMYMGSPISNEDSKLLIKRLEVNVENHKYFQKKDNVLLRHESFGGVLANTANQSYVMLTDSGVKIYNALPQRFKIDCSFKGVGVLQAANMIQPISYHPEIPEFKNEIDVISASRFFPRLAMNLPIDDKVRMLRADTGERIYF